MSRIFDGFRRVFCDTSFFYASLDANDAWHGRAMELAGEAAAAGITLSSTWDVIGETVTLLRYRRSFQAAIDFLNEVKPALDIVLYGETVRAMAEEIFRTRGSKHRLSFCDAVSFVVVTSLLENAPCLSFDEDFQALGLTVFR